MTWFFPNINSTQVLYFFDYKTDFFKLQISPRNLDPSYKVALDLWDHLRQGKTGILAKFRRTESVLCSHSREGKPS